MKKWTTVQTKSNVIIAWEDTELHTRDSIRLSYREAWGLMHALQDVRDNPEFEQRDARPTSEYINGEKKVVKHIVYEGQDD